MNGYVAFYKGKRVEIFEETLYRAKLQAQKELKVSDSQAWKIAIVLAEKDGELTTHIPLD